MSFSYVNNVRIKEAYDFKKIIESKNRSNAGLSVPAKGLFLTNITYDYLKKINPLICRTSSVVSNDIKS